ncbi:MAG: thioredoxin [Oscillospiraceae bacterium]|jgi:thioredoxin 1|nr:thioredoxin [Oscillospiraceae bacterium]
MQHLKTDGFRETIQSENKPVVLDFYADWCGPCRMQAPVFQDAETEANGRAAFYKINIDQEPELAEAFGVMSIPTIAVMKNNQVRYKNVGFTNKAQILEAVEMA